MDGVNSDIDALRRDLRSALADRDRLAAERDALLPYRAAFETTAADRDRLAAEAKRLAQYKYAFETTAADRDRLLLAGFNRDRGIELNAVLPFVVVLSRPRTASMNVQALICSANIVGHCEHIHALAPASIADFWRQHPWSKQNGRMLETLATISMKRSYAALGAPVGQAYFVTIVRDPIERACSDYFFFTHHRTGVSDENSVERTLALDQASLHAHLESRDWGSDSDWFYREFEDHLGFTFADPGYCLSPGYDIRKSGCLSLLILTVGCIDRLQGPLSKLVGHDVVVDAAAAEVNNAERFGYGAHYAAIVKGVRLKPQLFETIMATRWARQFFGDGERASMRARWVGAA